MRQRECRKRKTKSFVRMQHNVKRILRTVNRFRPCKHVFSEITRIIALFESFGRPTQISKPETRRQVLNYLLDRFLVSKRNELDTDSVK